MGKHRIRRLHAQHQSGIQCERVVVQIALGQKLLNQNSLFCECVYVCVCVCAHYQKCDYTFASFTDVGFYCMRNCGQFVYDFISFIVMPQTQFEIAYFELFAVFIKFIWKTF